jgi:hypothetical protein
MPGIRPQPWWEPAAIIKWYELEIEYQILEERKRSAIKTILLGTRVSPTVEAVDLKSTKSEFESQPRDQYNPGFFKRLWTILKQVD